MEARRSQAAFPDRRSPAPCIGLAGCYPPLSPLPPIPSVKKWLGNIIAVGMYAKPEMEVDALFKDVDAKLGALLVPPYICFPESYKGNIDRLALRHSRNGMAYPEPQLRDYSSLIAGARGRISKQTTPKKKSYKNQGSR